MDDDVYGGKTYEGVAWYCDNCGTLLNRQPGFTDCDDSWRCTSCGHINGTTEDDIINDVDEFCCPKCGSTLNKQPCFSKYDDDWTCTSCGTQLHHSYSDDEYSVVEDKFNCPKCGATLNEQPCFSKYDDDWICTSCGAHLQYNYGDGEYTIVNNSYDTDSAEECDEIESAEQLIEEPSYTRSDYSRGRNYSYQRYQANHQHCSTNDAFTYDCGITQDEFCEMVHKISKKLRRITSIEVRASRVYGTVRSQSKLTSWSFLLDFNDGGHLTGKYELCSTNDDALIPQHLGDLIQTEIQKRIQENRAKVRAKRVDDLWDDYQNVQRENRELRRKINKAQKAEETARTLRTENKKLKKENTRIRRRQRRQKNRKFWLILFAAMFVFSAVAVIFHKQVIDYIRMTPVGVSSDELTAMSCQDAVLELQRAGFTNIQTTVVEDLAYGDILEEGSIISITIAGTDEFSKTAEFRNNDRIEITYHAVATIEMPISSNDAIGLNYKDIQSLLAQSGFVNVKTVGVKGPPRGDVTEDGQVTNVLDSASTELLAGDKYRPDAPITIYYRIIELTTPISNEDIGDINYIELKELFEEAGFRNITVIPVYDLLIGWFVKEGNVNSVKINGSEEFTLNDKYGSDAVVEITYHALKKNQ